MEVVGKIILALPLEQGVSKSTNKPWQKQAYVLETQEQYPRKVHFEIFGEDRIKKNTCEIDEVVTVSFDIDSREYNGRWYTSIAAWKIEKGDAITEAHIQATEAAPLAPPAAPSVEVPMFDPIPGDEGTGLPF